MLDFDKFLEMQAENDQPTCPYCKHQQTDIWDVYSSEQDIYEEHEFECQKCERTFMTQAYLEWRSDKMEGDEDDNETGGQGNEDHEPDRDPQSEPALGSDSNLQPD